jgi:predicted nucleic-acid-binding Zn-ribbon protein
MDEKKKCLRCGSTNLEPGSIQSNGKVCFRPKKAKFLSTRSADVCVKANICIDCGHMEFVGDAKKTKLLVKGSSRQAVYPAGLS